MSDPSGIHSADPEKDDAALNVALGHGEGTQVLPGEALTVQQAGEVGAVLPAPEAVVPPAPEVAPETAPVESASEAAPAPEAAPAVQPQTSDPEASPDHPDHQSWLARLGEWLSANPQTPEA